MLKHTINILTSYNTPVKNCVMGNVAVARGAIEAGVCGVFSYPGTPSTEISEVFNYVNQFQSKKENQEKYPLQASHKIYFEYSINEKIALEKAIAYSIGNRSALCVMKNVGMNVASDALMSVTYQTIIAPLVIVICDDPGCFSSSNEQDSRYWGQFASVPMLNPATPADAYEMTKDAFILSEQLKLPVIVRMTTRVDHSRGVIEYNTITPAKRTPGFERLAQHINIPARTAIAHKTLLEKFNSGVFASFNKKFNIYLSAALKKRKAGLGIISSGVAAVYAAELIERNPGINISHLKIGVFHPFPENDILTFLKKGFKQILILEELDPLVENNVRIIAQKNKIDADILGKGFSRLGATGEYTLDIVRQSLEEITGISFKRNNCQPFMAESQKSASLLSSPPPRPPVLCSGCPHRATFYALKLAIPREAVINPAAQFIMCGDIGCFGLGALPPLQMIDTINHMGMSVSMAQGLSEALRMQPAQSTSAASSGKKTIALVGDGTFFHSGIVSLVNAIYTRANISVIIFDNRTIGMTGHQDHPGGTSYPKYKQVDIYSLVKGLGVEIVEKVNPFDLKDTVFKVKKAVEHTGVSVLIARSPCVFLPEYKAGNSAGKMLRVNPDKCNTCFNHCDIGITCSKEHSAKGNLVRAKAKILAESHIHGSEQLCPANICNHGFFNAITAGNYKEALEMVRDKMLFAKACGDICHKPCESIFRKGTGDSVPIKMLKNFVSGISGNFNDFSLQKSRAINAVKKNKKVAVIGAGPAGLSAAYDLVQQGYGITVFEKESCAGGMLRFIIPGFRMDKTGMEKEIEVLNDMGVMFKFNSVLGEDYTVEELSKKFDAVILAIGMWDSPSLDMIEKNVPEEKRFDAIGFLRQFNLGKLKLVSPSAFLVIGGGNSAMDAARAAKKLNPENEVIVSCIEKRHSMPAFHEEITNAVLEGIRIIDNSFIKEIEEKNNRLSVFLKIPEKEKPFEILAADFVISAIGQQGDKKAFNGEMTFDKNARIITVDQYPNVVLAGDILAGNHISLIGAIGSGKKAAVNVRKLLENYPYDYEGNFALSKLSDTTAGLHELKIKQPHPWSSELTALERFDLYQSCSKCDHCIENFGCPAMVKVNGKVTIDNKRCTGCGLCVDVCPNGAVEWVENNMVQ